MMFQLKWRVTSEQHGQLLRTFLQEARISKRALTDIKFAGGKLLVNGKEETVRFALRTDDEVICQFPLEQPDEQFIVEDGPLQLVYEDDYVLVINKQPGVPSIPSQLYPNGTIANWLLGYYRHIGLQATTHILTRLDKDTSGLMLIAKHRHIHHLLSQDHKQKQVNRTYEAYVHGQLRGEGIIDAPIGRKETSIIEREVRADGQRAVTHYTVLHETARWSHVQLQLETGRTHQIRVHLAHLGHPLLGDTLYGGEAHAFPRQALHSRELQFTHPVTGERLSFTVEWPNNEYVNL